MNTRMRKISSLLLAGMAATSASVARADDLDAQYRDLEARLNELEQARAPVASATVESQKIKLNGFLSASAGGITSSDFYYGSLENNVSFRDDAIIGLQVEGQVSDDMRAVMQLVANGNRDFDVDAEWAYVGYRASDHDEIRAGRQRLPFFMMSEYIEVGYTYPWARPPREVYVTGLPSSYNGIAWKHDFSSGSWQHAAQVFWGGENFGVAGGTLKAENATGVGLQSSTGDWQFSLSYTWTEATLTGDVDTLAQLGLLTPTVRDPASFASAGFQYDNGNVLLLAEATRMGVEGYYPDNDQSYLTVGYHFGKWMPHVTWARSRVTDGKDRPPAPPGTMAFLCMNYQFCQTDGSVLPDNYIAAILENAQNSVALGLRYDFMSNVAFKLDWTRVLDTKGTTGYFGRNDGMIGNAYMPDDDIDVFRFVVDVTF